MKSSHRRFSSRIPLTNRARCLLCFGHENHHAIRSECHSSIRHRLRASRCSNPRRARKNPCAWCAFGSRGRPRPRGSRPDEGFFEGQDDLHPLPFWSPGRTRRPQDGRQGLPRLRGGLWRNSGLGGGGLAGESNRPPNPPSQPTNATRCRHDGTCRRGSRLPRESRVGAALGLCGSRVDRRGGNRFLPDGHRAGKDAMEPMLEKNKLLHGLSGGVSS